MQVPQWADPIPMGRRGGPGPRAVSGGGGATVLITSWGSEFLS